MSPAPFLPPSLTVFAFLFWQWRWAGGDICILTGNVLGNKHAPICLGHGWDGCEKGERWRWMKFLFRQVVVLRGESLVQHPGTTVGEGRRLGAAPLLHRQGRGCADAGGLIGLGGPVILVLGWGSAEAWMRGVLSRNGGRGLAVRLGQGAEAPPNWYWGQVFPSWQVLVEEVIIWVVVICVVCKDKEKMIFIYITFYFFYLVLHISSTTSAENIKEPTPFSQL